ncbi:MAG: hypothetical protein LBQ51_08825 [Desulfovibrio sp.]|jgi:hypothetical protein|nr:hypothetical protein [Desulfovibrio sp.]
MDSQDAATIKNSPTAAEANEAKDYRQFYLLVAAISGVLLITGLYMLLDSLLLNAYKAGSRGIILASLGTTGLCVAFGLRHLHSKAFKTGHEQQLMEAQNRIAELEQKLADIRNKQPAFAADEGVQPDNSEITLSAWAKAIEEYTGDRKNDSLPDRMRILLRYLGGEKFSVLAQEMPGKNLSVYLKKAKEDDVPKLKAQFPVLPELNLSIGKAVGKS